MSNSAFETAFPKRHVLLQGHEYYRQERSRDENWALHLTYNEYQWLSWEIRCWKSKSFFFIGSAWQVLLHRLLSKVSKYKVSKIKIFWKEFSWNIDLFTRCPYKVNITLGFFFKSWTFNIWLTIFVGFFGLFKGQVKKDGMVQMVTVRPDTIGKHTKAGKCSTFQQAKGGLL